MLTTTSSRSGHQPSEAAPPPTIFQFSPSEFASLDFTRFCAHYCPTQRLLSSVMALRHSVGVQLPGSSMMGWVPKIDDDTRRFARAFFETFPHWGFFFSLQLPALWTLSLALVDDVELVTMGVSTQVRFRGRGISAIAERHLLAADSLSERAGASAPQRTRMQDSLRSFFVRSARLAGVPA